MGDYRLPEWVKTLDNVGRVGKQWTDYVAEDRQMFGITGDWSTTSLNPGFCTT